MTDPITDGEGKPSSAEAPAAEPTRQTEELACELAEEWNSAEPPSDLAVS